MHDHASDRNVGPARRLRRIVLLFSPIFLFGREHLSVPALHVSQAVVSSGCRERPARRRCGRAQRFQAAS